MVATPENHESIKASFEAEWERQRPNCVPIGWHLRNAPDVPWIRFHALPQSKRYAETEDEYATILSRGNWLASRLLGVDTSCWQVDIVNKDKPHVGCLVEEQGSDDEFKYYFDAKPILWRASKFDHVLREIADDQRQSLWINRSNGAIFAPYDGGFDLFPADPCEVIALKKAKASWLSSHPSGL